MNNLFVKPLFWLIISSLIIISCRKDTSPINVEKPPDRPTTGDAILTGHMYYGSSENRPANHSKIIIYFFNDYSDTLAIAEIDSAGKYYIDSLPEDTVDLIVTQPFYDNVLISSKISDIPLNPGINEVDAEQIYTQSWVDHSKLVPDYFMVKFDTTSQQTAIDSFNTYHNILSVKFYTSLINRDYYFLEIDPVRDILSLIEIYHNSDLTLEAGPVFYDPIRGIYHWSLGSVNTEIKNWVSLDQVERVASELNLNIDIQNNDYLFIMTKNTPMTQEQLRMNFYFCPLFRFANVVSDQTLKYDPAPWE
jgi:hypothetical protein